MTHTQAIARLNKLSLMINKYGHRWSDNPSLRMVSWVDEYNEIKRTHAESFAQYCKENDFSPKHDGYDCLA